MFPMSNKIEVLESLNLNSFCFTSKLLFKILIFLFKLSFKLFKFEISFSLFFKLFSKMFISLFNLLLCSYKLFDFVFENSNILFSNLLMYFF